MKAVRKEKRLETHKRKAKEANLPGPLCPMKQAVAGCHPAGSCNNENVTTISSAVANNSLDEGLDDEGDVPPVVNRRDEGRGDDERKTKVGRGRSESSGHSIPPRKHRKWDLDPGMDLLINAGCHPGMGCRRAVFDTCFDNGVAGGRFS